MNPRSYSHPDEPSLVDGGEFVVALLILGGIGLAWYVALSRYHLSQRQIAALPFMLSSSCWQQP